MSSDGFLIPSRRRTKPSNSKAFRWSTNATNGKRAVGVTTTARNVDLTPYIRDITIRNGVFEFRVPARLIPMGVVTFWRTGYVIKLIVQSGTSWVVVGELKIPQYVKPETISSDREIDGEHFRFRGDVVNCACVADKRKKSSRRWSIQELLPLQPIGQPEMTKRPKSFSNLRRTNSGYQDSSAGGDRTITRSRSMSIPDLISLRVQRYTVRDLTKNKARVKRRNTVFNCTPPPQSPTSDTGDPEGGKDTPKTRTRLKRSFSSSALLSKLSTKTRAAPLTENLTEEDVA